MNITKLNRPFVAQTILTAAQLNNITDTIDLIIDNWPSVTPGNGESSDEGSGIQDEINDAKAWITGKVADILALIAQFDSSDTHIRTDEEMLDLFKGEMGKAMLVHYGICDAQGHPYFNVLIDLNGVKPAAIIGAITDQNGKLSSQIGISADNIIIDGNVTLTNKLTALDAALENLDVSNTITGKHIIGGDINIGDGTFTVDSNGNVVAESITLNGQGHCIIRLTGQLVTLPDPRPGTIVTIVNETPTTPSSLSTDPMIVTKDRSTQFIRYFVANGSGVGSWSRASSVSEDSKLPAWIVEQIVYIQLVANGTNWYVTACIMKDGNLWPGDRTL